MELLLATVKKDSSFQPTPFHPASESINSSSVVEPTPGPGADASREDKLNYLRRRQETFVSSIKGVTAGDLVSHLRELVHTDADICMSLWQQLFKSIWDEVIF